MVAKNASHVREDVYRYLVTRYLKPRAEIMAEVEGFAQTHFAGRHVVGAHIRNKDKGLELGGDDPSKGIRQFVENYMHDRPDAYLFLMTDSSAAMAEYQERYGDRLVATDRFRSHNNKTVTHIATKPREELGREIMLDTYLGAQCDAFVGLGLSCVVAAVSNLADRSRTDITLIGPKLQTFLNPEPYLMDDPLLNIHRDTST